MSYSPPLTSLPPKGRPFGLRLSPSSPSQPHNLTPLTPISFLLRAALIYPKKVALKNPERGWQITYEVWAARCLNLAFALRGLGSSCDDQRLAGAAVPSTSSYSFSSWKISSVRWQESMRVAILAPNTPMILDAYHGVLAAGGIVVPLNIRNTPSEIQYVLEHSGASVILVDWELQGLLTEGARKGKVVVVCRDSGGQDPNDEYESFLAYGRQRWDLAQQIEAEHYLKSPRSDWSLLNYPAEENSPCALCYTSGTTGRPKGVLTTHRGSYLAAIANTIEASLTPLSTYLWVLPAFHACGWTFPWACVLSFATQLTLRKVDPERIWRALKEEGVTHYSGAPTVQISLVNHPSATRLSQEVKVAVAASAPTADLLGRMEELNLQPVHVYGLTESYGPMTRRYASPEWSDFPLGERARLMARQGHGFATADEARVVRLRDGESGKREVVVEEADGEERLVDVERDGEEIGEIALRGNIVMQGYFDDEQSTNGAVRGGYFLTGDLAARHPGGELEIKDRGKDVIISGGENISSLMVESELASHPLVLESSVVARSHEKWGERGHAFVVLRSAGKGNEGVAMEEELRKHCKARMSGFAVPLWWTFVDGLPKTSTGKVQKNVLRGRVAKL